MSDDVLLLLFAVPNFKLEEETSEKPPTRWINLEERANRSFLWWYNREKREKGVEHKRDINPNEPTLEGHAWTSVEQAKEGERETKMDEFL